MYNIQLKKINDTWMKVLCAEESTLHEIYEFYKFPDPKFVQNKWSKWDGVVRLFDKRSQKLYCGLIESIYKFAKSRNYKIHVDPLLMIKEDIDIHELERFIKLEFDPHSDGKPINPYDYQIDAIHKSLTYKRATLLAATNAGKSLVIYCIARILELQDEYEDRPILVVVPRVSLIHQIYDDFEDYASNCDDWNVRDHVQKITADESKQVNRPIVIANWQSLQKMPDSWFQQFGAILQDEAHTAQAKVLKGMISSMITTPFKVCMTGSLQNTECPALTVTGLFGPVHKIITAKELQDSGRAAKTKVFPIVLKHNEDKARTLNKEKTWPNEVDLLINDVQRQKFLVNFINNLSGNTIVLFHRIEHGLRIYHDLQALGKKVYYIDGSIDAIERNDIKKEIETMDDIVLVASFETTSMGVSIKKLHNLVLASSTKAQIKIIQTIGRLLRLHPSKDLARIFDIIDDLRYGKSANFGILHAAERFKIYMSEQHPIDKSKTINLDELYPDENANSLF